MSFVGALVLSAFTAIASFFAVSTVLNYDLLNLSLASIFDVRAGETRLSGFAMSGLAGSTSLATALRPLPALAEAGRKTEREARASAVSMQQPEAPLFTEGPNVLVAPLMRQAPVEPVLASDETTKPSPKVTALKSPKPTTPVEKVSPSSSSESPSLEAATRSALGGPKPVSTGNQKAAPVRRNASAPAAR